jgi:mannonate dehydratase
MAREAQAIIILSTFDDTLMQLATVLTPPSDENFALAAQCGVTDFVARYPRGENDTLPLLKRRAEKFGMALSVVEGYLPIEQLKLGRDDGTELAAMKSLLAEMGDLGIGLLCYNFMAGTDWVRTQLDAPERAGAKVTAFRLADVERAMSLSVTAPLGGTDKNVCATDKKVNGTDKNVCATDQKAGATDKAGGTDILVCANELWQNLERFLQELLPVAERFDVTFAAHPDDPPLPNLLGKDRILNCVEGFERLVKLVPSPRNGICFCQGTFATMGVDIPATIRRLGPHIKYVHFRDAQGTAADFAETFHDNGPTDMAAAMRAYRDAGFSGLLRPDHVPQMFGEDDGEPGYTVKGRLFAYGYMRGLMHGL